MILNSFLTHNVSFKHRIYVGLAIIIASFTLTTVLAALDKQTQFTPGTNL